MSEKLKGWHLDDGDIKSRNLSEEILWVLHGKFFSKKTVMKNLYKLTLLKSIVEVSAFGNGENNIFESLLEKFGENYLNFKVKNDLNVTIYNGKSKMCAQDEVVNNLITKNTYYKDLLSDEKIQYLKNTKKIFKKNVIGALYSDFDGNIYYFNKKKEKIKINDSFKKFYEKNFDKILDLINFRIIEFLKISSTETIKIEKFIASNSILLSEDYYFVIDNFLKSEILDLKIDINLKYEKLISFSKEQQIDIYDLIYSFQKENHFL